jgi:hypothetical protein
MYPLILHPLVSVAHSSISERVRLQVFIFLSDGEEQASRTFFVANVTIYSVTPASYIYVIIGRCDGERGRREMHIRYW